MIRLVRMASLALFALGMGELTSAQAADRKPNIVILLADDLGFGDLGFQGGKDIPTPRLDALAQSGVRCTNGYVSGPYCSPTRAGLLTGRYQERFGHEFNPGGEGANVGRAHGLSLQERSLIQNFQDAGYVTGLVGKWHLGGAPEYHPQKRGFTEFYGFLGGAHPYVAGQGAPIYRGTEVVVEKEYLTDAFAREAVSFIERHKDQPFLLELAFNAVHTPMQATDGRTERFSSINNPTRRTYAGMLTALDEAVGKVLDALKTAGLERDTLIFFFSDNGGPTLQGTSINGSTNTPLKGSKRTTLEGGVHVPFVISWKGTLPEGKTYDRLLIQLDVLPTALAAAGIAHSADLKLDGVDILPSLKGESKSDPHSALYWRFGEQTAICKGDWKLVRYDVAVDHPGQKSTAGGPATPPRLYNLADDIAESHDLAAEHPEKVEELTRDWQAWNAELVPPSWGPAEAPAATPAKAAQKGAAAKKKAARAKLND